MNVMGCYGILRIHGAFVSFLKHESFSSCSLHGKEPPDHLLDEKIRTENVKPRFFINSSIILTAEVVSNKHTSVHFSGNVTACGNLALVFALNRICSFTFMHLEDALSKAVIRFISSCPKNRNTIQYYYLSFSYT